MNYLLVFLLSMVPVVELRGSIPLAAGFGIPWYYALIVAIIGNMLPVPIIIILLRKIMDFMKKTKHLSRFANWLENRIQRQSVKVAKYETLGLFFFVAIPLPGTGGWTGAMIASLLDIRMKYALPSILAGICVAGLIVTGISYGFLTALAFLL